VSAQSPDMLERCFRSYGRRVLAAASPSEEDSIQTAPQTLTPLEIAPTVRLISVKVLIYGSASAYANVIEIQASKPHPTGDVSRVGN
jgi:hypothetical protein